MRLLSVEVIVESVDRAIEILVDCLGGTLLDRRRSEEPVGELAMVAFEGVVLTVMQPSPSGPGYVLPVREPRFSQLVFSASDDEVRSIRHDCATAGLALSSAGDTGFFITPESVVGALGVNTAIVVTTGGNE